MALSTDIMGLGLDAQLAALLGFVDLNAVTAAGTTSGTATVLAAAQNNIHVTSASSQTGVRLPAAPVLSTFYFIRNRATSTASLNVYPPTGGTINALATDGPLAVPAGESVLFYPYIYSSGSALSWNGIPSAGIDLTSILASNNTWTGTNTFSGVLTPSGGVASALSTMSPRLWYTGNQPAISTTTPGTDTTPSSTETYLAELFVGSTISSTGVSLFNGSAVSGNITLYLSNSASTNLAHTASTAQAGTAAYQQVAWVGGPITILGPATYFVLLQVDNGTARYRSHAIGNFAAGKLTATTYGTFPASFTPPTTFTASLGPIAGLY